MISVAGIGVEVGVVVVGVVGAGVSLAFSRKTKSSSNAQKITAKMQANIFIGQSLRESFFFILSQRGYLRKGWQFTFYRNCVTIVETRKGRRANAKRRMAVPAVSEYPS